MSNQLDSSQTEHVEAQEQPSQFPEEITDQANILAEIQELLKQLPEELLANVLTEKIQQEESSSEVIKIVKAVSRQFSGPIPPPHVLGDYDKVQPGFAERIIVMAEKEQAHRHGMEHQALSSGISIQKRGQIFALLVSLVILGGSMFLIYSGKEISGSLLAGASLTGLAYIFITGRKHDEPADEEGS